MPTTKKKNEKTLVDRAREVLEARALAGLGMTDTAIVLALAGGMAAELAGSTDDEVRAARVAGARIVRRLTPPAVVVCFRTGR